jgi:L-ascorbate metabolism protein UlaG (beta-lactamase superfamily)
MKKWLVRIAFVLAFILTGLIILVVIDENDKTVIKSYTKNENLTTIKLGWPGVPVDEKGRFVNYEHPFLPKIVDLFKWQFAAKPQKAEKENDKERLAVLDPADFLSGDRDGILWLGHASFFIRLAGKSILLDPVFGKPSFVKTLVDVPSPLEKIKRVDYVLLSHDHRDHCDEESIKQIAAKFPEARFYGGLRMDELFREWIPNETQSAGWFQQFKLPDDRLKIYFLPVRHWCRRGLFDTNERLWGGYVIEGAGRTVYFSGDSGYGSHFGEITELFPKIDYFLIGIGAYSPRWFMEPNHNSPEEALKAAVDARAATIIPMHFGRFDLSDEPPSEPLRLFKEKAAEMNLSDKIKPLDINQNIYFEPRAEK